MEVRLLRTQGIIQFNKPIGKEGQCVGNTKVNFRNF